MTPRQVVDHLDRYIIGQNEAKKAVAIAMRNRWRRHRVPTPLKSEIVPKNILMIGPTGCGKTEIARRLAKIADAPFVKVEASKYTELGYVGRDVDGIIRDLVDNAVNMVKQRHKQRQQGVIDRAVEKKIIDALCTPNGDERTRGSFLQLLRDGKLEDRLIEIEISSGRGGTGGTGTGGRFPPPQLGPNLDNNSPTTNRNEFMSDISAMVQSLSFTSREKQTKKLPVADARSILAEREAEKLMNQDMIIRQALKAAAEDGIVFIDEIDKIVSPSDSWRKSADASAEGVQRDLLPIIEGSVVNTRYGPLNTDHVLFICGGAFHSSKPSDLMAELQGRLPIRVELKGLTKEDFYRILTEPENNLIKQNTALLETENVHLIFTDAAVNEISLVAEEVNINVENIGARRLHTIMEKILEEVSYSAAEKGATPDAPVNVVIDKEDVIEALAAFREKQDLSRYIL